MCLVSPWSALLHLHMHTTHLIIQGCNLMNLRIIWQSSFRVSYITEMTHRNYGNIEVKLSINVQIWYILDGLFTVWLLQMCTSCPRVANELLTVILHGSLTAHALRCSLVGHYEWLTHMLKPLMQLTILTTDLIYLPNQLCQMKIVEFFSALQIPWFPTPPLPWQLWERLALLKSFWGHLLVRCTLLPDWYHNG